MSAQPITEQQAAGLALAVRRGRASKWHLKGRAKRMYDDLSLEELEALADPDDDAGTAPDPRQPRH